jgi:hypothetical protein
MTNFPRTHCEWCGDPFETPPHASQKYHPECKKDVHRNDVRLCQNKQRRLKRYLKKHPRRPGSIVNDIGEDYLTMKLNGTLLPAFPTRKKFVLNRGLK